MAYIYLTEAMAIRDSVKLHYESNIFIRQEIIHNFELTSKWSPTSEAGVFSSAVLSHGVSATHNPLITADNPTGYHKIL